MTTPHNTPSDTTMTRSTSDADPWNPGPARGPVERDGHPRQCSAMSSQSGERCRAFAIKGGSVCRSHGGSAPAVRAKAEARRKLQQAEADAGRVLAHEGVGRAVVDPFDALAELASEALALKDALASRVNALEQIRYTAPGSGTEQIRAELALYERAMDRAGKFLDMVIKSNIAERRIEIERAKVDIVMSLLDQAIVAAGLTEEQRAGLFHAMQAGVVKLQSQRAPVVAGELA